MGPDSLGGMPRPTFCIVGAGLAGGRAAIALRERGFDGRLVLIGEEADPPYERPPLSKSYLAGELARDKLFLQAPDAYSQQSIELHRGARALVLDRTRRRVEMSDGELLEFDRLLLATGSRPRTLAIPGADLDGVFIYRTLADADSLRARLENRPRVVVLGGGFLGSELAAAAQTRGCQVTIVEAGEGLVTPLGPLVSQYCAELHLRSGVRLLFRESAAQFLGAERVEQVLLRTGTSIPCDLALVCVGAEPNSQLARDAGLEVDPGVVVGDRCRTASDEIFAAGDVASCWSTRWKRRLRVEHYDNALQQGLFVAGAMLGDTDIYDPVPYFWTEQYHDMIQQVGLADGSAEAVLRGDAKTGKFSVFYVSDGRLSGCVAVNRFPDLAAARRVIRAGIGVTPELLRNPALDLRAWSLSALEASGGAPE